MLVFFLKPQNLYYLHPEASMFKVGQPVLHCSFSAHRCIFCASVHFVDLVQPFFAYRVRMPPRLPVCGCRVTESRNMVPFLTCRTTRPPGICGTLLTRSRRWALALTTARLLPMAETYMCSGCLLPAAEKYLECECPCTPQAVLMIYPFFIHLQAFRFACTLDLSFTSWVTKASVPINIIIIIIISRFLKYLFLTLDRKHILQYHDSLLHILKSLLTPEIPGSPCPSLPSTSY